jgi:putative FmdB family regulatory protein
VEKIMPIYEYACRDCRNVFEKWLKLSETSENAHCPQCGSLAQRILSHTSFVLKGGGWYVTDYGYRKGASDDGQNAAGDAAAPPDTSTADGSETNAVPAPVAATADQAASGTAGGASA